MFSPVWPYSSSTYPVLRTYTYPIPPLVSMEHPNNDQRTSVEQHLNLTPGLESGKVGLLNTHHRGLWNTSYQWVNQHQIDPNPCSVSWNWKHLSKSSNFLIGIVSCDFGVRWLRTYLTMKNSVLHSCWAHSIYVLPDSDSSMVEGTTLNTDPDLRIYRQCLIYPKWGIL